MAGPALTMPEATLVTVRMVQQAAIARQVSKTINVLTDKSRILRNLITPTDLRIPCACSTGSLDLTKQGSNLKITYKCIQFQSSTKISPLIDSKTTNSLKPFFHREATKLAFIVGKWFEIT
jgi:hypothetical protein